MTAMGMAGANVQEQTDAPLDATAQLLTFDAGMYAVDLQAPRSVQSGMGLALPCARLDPVSPSTDLPGRGFVSMMSDGGWLSHGDLPVFIRVVGGNAGIMLTIYKSAGGMAAPELRVRYIRDDLDFQLEADGPFQESLAQIARVQGGRFQAAGQTSGDPAPVPDWALHAGALKLSVLAHLQTRGDVQAQGGEWAGAPGSHLLLEGFAVVVDAESGIDEAELEYQGILGDNWSTPWFAAGEFCGSRGMALPMLGFRVRLTGRAAESHDCLYAGSFVGHGEIGPIGEGQACEADGQPLDALCIAILPKKPSDAIAPTPEQGRRTPQG